MRAALPFSKLTEILDAAELDRATVVHQQAVDATTEVAFLAYDAQCPRDQTLTALELSEVPSEDDRAPLSGQAQAEQQV